MKEDPPDVDAAIKSLSDAQKEIQKAIDNNDVDYITKNWSTTIAAAWSSLPTEAINKLNGMIE